MRLWTTLLACGLVAASPRAEAALVLDDFNGPAGGQATMIQNGSVNDTATVTSLDPSVVGGVRQIVVVVESVLPGGSLVLAEANTPTTPGNFQLSNSVTLDSLATITYSESGAGLNLDLRGSTILQLEGVLNDLATSYVFTLETFGGGTTTCTRSTPAGFMGTVSCDFAEIFDGVMTNNVDLISINVDTPRGGDVLIDRFVLTPEPGAAVLLLLAAGPFASLARRRRIES
jgi:hypothetical protein